MAVKSYELWLLSAPHNDRWQDGAVTLLMLFIAIYENGHIALSYTLSVINQPHVEGQVTYIRRTYGLSPLAVSRPIPVSTLFQQQSCG